MLMNSYQYLAVFDVGKTNLKFSLLDEAGRVVYSKTTPNHVLEGPPYPHYDLGAMFAWLKDQMREAKPQPQAVIVTTHGATGALLRGDELALPVLDYEYHGPDTASYPRPDFSETASPDLPNGLNLGRQLYWQQQNFPTKFADADTFLMYPQYWAFCLSGVKATEVTSFGAHTDLWNPYKGDFSSLVTEQGWNRLLPPRQPAWAVLGSLREEIALEVGYTQPCDVLCGVHDSNASLVPYLGGDKPTVVSTGTWVISFVAGGSLEHLREDYDLLANVNIFAQAVPTARYMGRTRGRPSISRFCVSQLQ
jgi:L-fuculokinase